MLASKKVALKAVDWVETKAEQLVTQLVVDLVVLLDEQKAERMVLKTAGRMVALTELKLVDQWVWM